jgi:enoyl-CoA hydratase/carnithine racemase
MPNLGRETPMSSFVLENYEEVAILRLNNGVTNSLSPALIDELGVLLKEIESKYRGLVVAGGDKFFSIGLELPTLLKLDKKGMSDFYYNCVNAMFHLYTMKIPTACAAKAHAIAAGTIILLTCDYRYAASGRTLIGLNEIQLGLPVPYLADLMLRSVAGDSSATDLMYSGEMIDALTAEKKGILNEAPAKEDVEKRAIEKIHGLSKLPSQSFEAIKANRVEVVKSMYERGSVEKNEEFLRQWFTPSTQELLKDAAKKF